MARGSDKGMKQLEGQMAAPLANLPMTVPARPTSSRTGWTLKPYIKGQTGRLANA